MHLTYMQRTLELAKRGQFSAAPNPAVGCVIVRNGQIVGEGFHERTGEPHAEVHALRQAGVQARGATAYVTLEPCAHYGRTPPCAQALIDAGIAHVVIATQDPNPLVAGKGIALLEAAGITTQCGILEKEAHDLNRAFFYRITHQRPYVRLKMAATMDGKTALPSGESQWITGEAARHDAHYWRLRSDAIIAGCGSIIDDNARLSARYPTKLTANPPLKVIIDSQLRTPSTAAALSDGLPTLIATTTTAPERHYPAHVELLRLPASDAGKVPLTTLLDELGARQINSVWVEAGAGLAGAFYTAALYQEIILYLAPFFLGDGARGLLNAAPPAVLSDKIAHRISDSRALGDDWRFILTRADQSDC
ncbi:bifunctional diaminohydroxyphosphoribosylaminopyrimidine deaminase/5-amino-6-(5-phosphoribosylamino)uracil reductase RibD [Cardiobacteriaceae bacterium TAE3-ERU3]|nr:bifunctional diaminohydroxyphosphoribosylaminopyrimidine deaminase/5-amino-6-(5-phosphoribosylamino)uracil reductase RibD [Cardiobacteriaceae bacterium TAE3-ERU3]